MSEKKKRQPGGAAAPGSASMPASPGSPASTKAPEPPRPSKLTGSPMDVGLLEQLVRLMAANDLNTVEVREGDKRVVLKRGPATPTFAYAPPMPAGVAQAPPSQPQAAAGAGAGTGAATAPHDESAGLVAIKAEMVGTFYSSPKPGEAAFVNVGSTVDEESTVCVIEAMKNFFPVKAGLRGSIAKVLVQNGQTVQFDQPLFLVKPG